MDGVYHASVTATVTFNPFLPAIGRVYQVLLDAAPRGATIEINNRDLAAAAGLKSAGHIPRLLRQLEAGHYIERVADRDGSLIVVTDRSRMRDHPLPESLGDPDGDPDRDQPPIAASGDPDRDHPDRVLMRDRSSVRPADRSHMRDHPDSDSPPDPPMVLDSSKQQQQRARAFVDLLTAEGVNERDASAIADVCPERTIAEFRDQVALAVRLGKRSPRGLIISLWRSGGRLIDQESCDERRPVQPDYAARPTQRFVGPPPHRAASAAPARSHIPAGLLGVPEWFDELAAAGHVVPVG